MGVVEGHVRGAVTVSGGLQSDVVIVFIYIGIIVISDSKMK